MNRRLILFLSYTSCTLAAISTSCNQGGEYCQNHWDCCSNTCLSFLYQCSHILSSDMEPLPVQSAPAYFAPPAIPTIRPDTMSYESLLEYIFGPRKFQPTAVGREVNSINPRLAELTDEDEPKTVEEVINTTTNGPECLEIGTKCYFNEECCTKRCHGFLHRCVT